MKSYIIQTCILYRFSLSQEKETVEVCINAFTIVIMTKTLAWLYESRQWLQSWLSSVQQVFCQWKPREQIRQIIYSINKSFNSNNSSKNHKQKQGNHRYDTLPALCSPITLFPDDRPHRLHSEFSRFLFALAWHTEWSLLLHDVIGD